MVREICKHRCKKFKITHTLPFKYTIPHYIEDFITQYTIRRYLKFYKRKFFMWVYQNSHLEQRYIKDNQINILWINLSANSLGDSLMDLSSRVLLKNKYIDLFTDTKNADLYRTDNYFHSVITDEKQLKKCKYDLVLIDSFGTKSLRIKFKYFKHLPYAGMFGFFNGPEVNRVLFSYHRMNQLLGYTMSENTINAIAQSHIFIDNNDKKIIAHKSLPQNYICIAIGGEWQYRTFTRWDIIIIHIQQYFPDVPIVLIGSKNALLTEKKIMTAVAGLTSMVGKLSFNQTVEVIKHARLFIGCDGGLMHGAIAVNTALLPLFARLKPHMQLTQKITAFPLYDDDDVNNINPKAIIEKFTQWYYNV